MAIEIVDLPIENGGSFHGFLYVYQRVTLSQNPTRIDLGSEISINYVFRDFRFCQI